MPFIRIDDIDAGMRNIAIEGKIINMNPWMLVIEDESGQTFVRYRQRNLKAPVAIGDTVKIKNARAVEWSGVLQLKLDANGEVSAVGRVIAED
ncbi:MAG: hypothetical protein V1857_05610 [archaeon]